MLAENDNDLRRRDKLRRLIGQLSGLLGKGLKLDSCIIAEKTKKTFLLSLLLFEALIRICKGRVNGEGFLISLLLSSIKVLSNFNRYIFSIPT